MMLLPLSVSNQIAKAGSSLTIETSDLGTVEVKLAQNSNVTEDMQYIEVVGKVDDQGETIREFTCVGLGDNLSECISSLISGPDD